jgi:hypothetical protein
VRLRTAVQRYYDRASPEAPALLLGRVSEKYPKLSKHAACDERSGAFSKRYRDNNNSFTRSLQLLSGKKSLFSDFF